jgi:type I restriction enzyme R subunit
MTRPQTEQQLENALLKQLGSLGYKSVAITDEKALVANLKNQLEKHNQLSLQKHKKTIFSEKEFAKVLNLLNKGSIFDRAGILRGEQHIISDEGKPIYFNLLNQIEWCKNEFQVVNQITQTGEHHNRYDVTILINGLPLVHIELKKKGVEMGQAFNQINRYKSHSFGSGYAFFNYTQLFIISNGVNTKYYANNREINSEQTFYWADEENNKISNLSEFSDIFLEPCHLSKMISKYIVLASTTKQLMVLRPYQYYAAEKIYNQVKNTNKNGYIWHTTGSGKTLTSFKASQLLMNIPEVYKVVFVVDRRDLDTQTIQEFNNFKEGSVDSTTNTKSLMNQFVDGSTKLMVTTIQKLNNAITRDRYTQKMESLKDKKVVFIFDECHRSQFGETHGRIVKYFINHQMFGFTGTPIFAENAVKNQLGKRTTKELFGDCLHKYVITDAIRDTNVLKFAVEYVGKYTQKNTSSLNFADVEVEGIDKKEIYDSPERLEKITDYIIANHSSKTGKKENSKDHFTAMFAVSSVDTLTKYYDLFKQKDHNLKIATIFSYSVNEENDDGDRPTTFDDDMFAVSNKSEFKYSRDKLEEYLADYKEMFGVEYTTKDSQSYYNYYRDIARRVKNKEIDILLVVNMFLTGFDSKPLNTLYVDKNLKHHGLIQAFSRTNRILNKNKSHGNIVVFRNLKKATDEAVALFSNKDANEIIFMQPYEEYLNNFGTAYDRLQKIAPTVDSVDDLLTEEDEAEFVKSFRAILRVQNILSSFSDFSFSDLDMTHQEFNDYKSKYLDLYEKVKRDNNANPDSALEDIDFEIELMHRDVIDVTYIINLLSLLVDAKGNNFEVKKKQISDMLSGDVNLRSKKKLIEQFIEDNLIHITNSEDVPEAFDTYWSEQKIKSFQSICDDENLDKQKIEAIVEEYLYSGQVPEMDYKVSDAINTKLKLKEKIITKDRVIDRIMGFLNTFFEGLAA